MKTESKTSKMKKELPTSENNVYDHDQSLFEDSTGISKKRAEKVFSVVREPHESNKKSVEMEEWCKQFSKKELAMMAQFYRSAYHIIGNSE